eukprot:8698965-Lingulodinium_polyedra.AAC.1
MQRARCAWQRGTSARCAWRRGRGRRRRPGRLWATPRRTLPRPSPVGARLCWFCAQTSRRRRGRALKRRQ